MKWTSDAPSQPRPSARKPSMAPKSPQPPQPPTSPTVGGLPPSDTIKAYVRVRPKGESEEADYAVRMANATCEVTTNKRGRDTKYTFTYDDCFWSGDAAHCGKQFASQDGVFQAVGVPLVDNVMQGYNSAIIAYGQTGSGKTYSIFGPVSSLGTPDEGLIPRVCSELFHRLQDLSRDGRTMWTVHMTMVEVYLEDVFDLLHNRRKLSIRGDCTQGFHVVGGKRIPVTTYREIEAALATAESWKTFAATAIHERSSRAHTIFQLELTLRTESYTRSPKLVLADLAGSERIKVAKTDTGTALEQACNINLSLLALGNCIEAVMARSKGEKTTDVGEFRTSTLTKLLKDHIGGNSRSAILVTISPTLRDAQLSLQALRFGDRAKHLQTHAKIIQSTAPDNAELMQQNIVQDLERRRELLEKERELRMQEISLDQRRADLERQSQQLLLAKAQLQQSGQQDYESRVKLIDAQLQGLQQQLRDMHTQKDELDSRFLDVCADHQATLSDVQALQRQVERLTAELDGKREEHADDMALQELELRTDHESLIKEKDSEIAQLRSTHDSVSAEMTQHFVVKLADAERRASSLQDRLDSLLVQHDQTAEELKQAHSTTRKDTDMYNERIQQLRAELDAQAQAHRCALQTADGERSTLSDQHVAVTEQRDQFERALTEASRQRDALETRAHSLEGALAERRASEDTLRAALNVSRDEHTAALAAAEAERRQFEDRLAAVGASQDDLGAELASLRQQLQSAEDEGRAAAATLSSTQAVAASLGTEATDLKEQLAQATADHDSMRVTADNLQKSLGNALSGLESAKLSEQDAQERIAELEAELQHMTPLHEEARRRADLLEKDLAAATSREGTLSEVIDDLREEIQMANNDAENLRATQASNNRLHAEAQEQVVLRQERIFNLEGLLKATAAQLSTAEAKLQDSASGITASQSRVAALESELRSARAASAWALDVMERALLRPNAYFTSLEVIVDDFGKAARRCHDDVVSVAMDTSVSMQRRIGSADVEITTLTAELATARKNNAHSEGVLREELATARALASTQELQQAELRRAIAGLEADLTATRVTGRQTEQALREDIVELKRQLDALHEEQSSASQGMRQRLQEEANYTDMLVQQCMAAQRALTMGLREVSMRQPVSSRSSLRRPYDEEMTPRKEQSALRHFNPNLRGMLNDDTVSENGTDASAR